MVLHAALYRTTLNGNPIQPNGLTIPIPEIPLLRTVSHTFLSPLCEYHLDIIKASCGRASTPDVLRNKSSTSYDGYSSCNVPCSVFSKLVYVSNRTCRVCLRSTFLFIFFCDEFQFCDHDGLIKIRVHVIFLDILGW